MPKLTFKPVTAKTVDQFIQLFGARGGPNWCWCMAFRATPIEIRQSAERKKQILARIEEGVPVGLLAYEAGEPVGWVSLGPKQSFRGLGGVEEHERVWSLTCLFVRANVAGRG